jgi:hypothetical protein
MLCSGRQMVETFVHILLLTGHDDVAKLLSHNLLQIDITDLLDLSRCDPRDVNVVKFTFGEERQLSIDKLNVTGSINSINSVYTMISSPRGYCLLINNHFTVGTYKEMQRFRNIFYQLHFDVIMKKNMNKIEIINFLREISHREELGTHNAFVLMMIAHGNEKNEIYGFDGEEIKIRDLMDTMNAENCPRLRSKPRMFFFNCCRGSEKFLTFF